MTALRVFNSVVENGSFSGAARSLRLSNAAVSKNIAELEAHLGVELISRTTRRMRLTDAGSDYHQKIERILGDLDDADDAISDCAASPRGKLRVTAPMSFGLIKLASLVPEFLEVYPEIVFDLDLNDANVDLITEHFDVAVRGSGKLKDSNLVARKLMELERVVCASPAYLDARGVPKTPEDLLAHRCVIYSLSSEPGNWRLSRGGEPAEISVSGAYRVNNSIAIREALLSGVGIAIIPRIYVEDDLRRGDLVTILGEWETVTQSVFSIFPSGKFLPQRTRVFVDFLVERLSR